MIIRFKAWLKTALRNKKMRYVLVAIAIFIMSVPTYAQTPVPLVINTNDIMTQTNTWIATFSPIQAIGIGMALALAILGFIGAMMISAFSKNRK